MDGVKSSTVRRGVLVRDWTKGSLIRNLLFLSWPVIVGDSFWGVGMTLDMVWLGRLGAASVAGAGVSFFVIMLVLTLQSGLSMGARAMVARFIGAGDVKMANHVVGQAFVMVVVYSAVVTPLGFFLAEPILRLFGLEAEAVAEGAAYMRIMFAGWVSLGLLVMAESVLQASGDTMTPSWIVSVFMAVHILLSPSLVFGWWIFPPLGVRGPAVAFVTAFSLMTLVVMWILFTGRSRLRLTLKGFRFDLNIIWRIVKIGLPASVMGLQSSLGNLVFTRLFATFGTVAVAAFSLVQRGAMLVRLPSNAFGAGASVLVGQNLGAGQPERAQKSGWLAVVLGESFMVIVSIAILLWATDIVFIFTTESELVKITSIFLQIEVVAWLAFGLGNILQRCLLAAGDTLPPMLVSLGDLWLVRLPLALLLPGVANLGVYGVNWAMVSGLTVGAIAYAVYFRTGRWQRKKI